MLAIKPLIAFSKFWYYVNMDLIVQLLQLHQYSEHCVATIELILFPLWLRYTWDKTKIYLRLSYFCPKNTFINFFFFCSSNPKNPDKLFLSDKNRLTLSHLNTSNPLVIYLHGFSERATGINGRSGEQIRDGK